MRTRAETDPWDADGVLRVGLTGGIGSGKSEVAAMLAERGAVVIDADQLARQVVEPGTPGHTEVLAAFGQGVLRADGSLDRPALAARVFSDPEAKRRLEAVIHPRVRARAAELEEQAASDAVVVHDIPLLVETGQTDWFDLVVVVDAPADTALRRLTEQRGMTAEQVRQRADAQSGRQERLDAADVVIDNSGSREALRAQVEQLWNKLAAQASAKAAQAD